MFSEQVKRVGLRKALAWNVYVAANEPLRLLSLALDKRRDLRICGVSLVNGKFSENRESKGATNSISTPYGALDEILGHEEFSASDAIVDIGCGHGRVLAYLVDTGFESRICGIELDREVSEFAKRWSARYPNIEVITGDAFEQDLSGYTVFYLWKPMLQDVFRRFIVKIEAEATRPVRLYYLTDFDTAALLSERSGWTRVWTKRIYRHRGLPLFYSPQDCSAWIYTP